ncbi:MAG TPA: hypothetical protein VK154_10170 [Chitinophagales bacterium]|nr:hypothetical protein [Chitinophagales bacterium]
MFQLCCKITIGELVFKMVNEVEINTSFKNFTDTCIIKLPRKVYMPGEKYNTSRLDTQIKRGQAVKVELGYNDKLQVEFAGYVASVKPTVPVEVHCEDDMFLLKQVPVKPKNFQKAALKDVLDYIGVKKVKASNGQMLDYKLMGDVKLDGAFHITNETDTAAKVLKKLKDECPILFSFMRNGKLCIGDAYEVNAPKVKFAFGSNIISHSLAYRRKEEVKFSVTVTSKNDNGKDKSIKVGDSDGDQRTFTVSNKSESDMKKLGQQYLEQLQFDGYRGSFTAFGEPAVQHGNIAELADSEEKEKDGNYYIDGVKKTFGQSGYRQEIELGKKAS